MLPERLKFNCGTLAEINGHQVKALKPDANGCYEVVLGCIGIPTRRNVIYDPDSLVRAMNDPESVFNICLRDGQLCGEYGHPDIDGSKESLRRLLVIREETVSHAFRRIWIDDEEIQTPHGTAHPIKAIIKPTGPYGKVLEEQLRDPVINNAFSIRSLCTPMPARGDIAEIRKVNVLVTFDAVNAPGYEIASKRYCRGTESLMDIDPDMLNDIVRKSNKSGTESIMVSPAQLSRLRYDNPKQYRMNHRDIGCHRVGLTIFGTDGVGYNLTDLMLKRRG